MRFFVVIALMLAAHVWLIIRGGKEKRRSQHHTLGSVTKALSILVLIADILGIGLLVWGMCFFEYRWYMTLCWILAGLLTLVLIHGLLFHRFTKKRTLLWLVCALAVGGVIGGAEGYEAYIRSITLVEEFDYRTYMPFREGSLVQTLDEPAAFRFSAEDKLPRMDGATALFPVYAAFCQAVYPPSLAEEKPSDLNKVITCSTTTTAYKDIVDGRRDIIFVAGPSEAQEAYAAERGVELVYTPIGREAFVFFVNPKNPVDGLTLEQIRGIYSGRITNWEELGAKGLGKILAYQRDEGSGSQTALKRFVMRDTPLMQPEKEEVIDGMGGIVEQVSAYKNRRNAIGYSFRFYCTALMKGFDIKLLAVEGVAPTVENIENGSYPLASSFYAVTRSDADANTLALLEWITGPQGQALVEKTGYTPIGAEAEQQSAKGK